MTDLAVPAHVHNIPHMFIDLPKIGKCDFEEFLGLDNQLFELGKVDIGDISSYEVNSFDEFYKRLDDIAKYTFLNSCFTAEQLREIAADRMVFGYDNVEELIEKMKKVGVEILHVEGYLQENRYYVRNLTSMHCEKISMKTTYFSLKMIAPCFLFLIGQVSGRFKERYGENARREPFG
jgi:hypothetical protein